MLSPMAYYRKVRLLSAIDAAYIAGLVDGEGTVTLSQEHRTERRRLAVTVSSTERALLEFLRDAVGAGQITRKRTYSPKHTPSFAYKITNRQAIDLLSQIASYLRSYKVRRAALALERYIQLTPRNGRYTPELLRARDAFEREFLNLQSEGTRRGTPSARAAVPAPPESGQADHSKS